MALYASTDVLAGKTLRVDSLSTFPSHSSVGLHTGVSSAAGERVVSADSGGRELGAAGLT
jgi:hypothetical protein